MQADQAKQQYEEILQERDAISVATPSVVLNDDSVMQDQNESSKLHPEEVKEIDEALDLE